MRFIDEPEKSKSGKETADLIDDDTLFSRYSGGTVRTVDEDDEGALNATESGAVELPKITRMPEGMTVIEQQIGHAIGQWVFVMLCDCGRRWFSLQAQEKAQCPRCNCWVHIEASHREPG
ncbi:MAG: hypothetical protein ACRC6L_09510 [Steroidobacteraceae bacterium]